MVHTASTGALERDAAERLHDDLGRELLVGEHDEVGALALDEAAHEAAHIGLREQHRLDAGLGGDLAADRGEDVAREVGREGEVAAGARALDGVADGVSSSFRLRRGLGCLM